jgi:hypothetical protein
MAGRPARFNHHVQSRRGEAGAQMQIRISMATRMLEGEPKTASAPDQFRVAGLCNIPSKGRVEPSCLSSTFLPESHTW